MYNANLSAPHLVIHYRIQWVVVVLVALKCEAGRGCMNDAITVVNFGESIAHNVYINYRGLCNICKKFYY